MKERMEARDIQLCHDGGPFSVILKRGEIVGLSGLEGHGQQMFLKTLCGIHKPHAGTVYYISDNDEKVAVSELNKAVRLRVFYLPRERKTEGIFPALSVFDNFSIGLLSMRRSFSFVNRKNLNERLEEYRKRLSIVYSSKSAQIRSLSGGNQQKILLARWMTVNPSVLLLDDPTRGVDIRTKNILYGVFKAMAEEENITLVLLSTEIEEIIQLCDRIFVFHNKGLFQELSAEEQERGAIMDAMFGRTHESLKKQESKHVEEC